jgi:HlyD family secretion protein
MDGGKAKFQAIQTGLLGELNLEVVSGLAEGDTLITGPFKSLRTLKPGDPVKKEEKKKDGDRKPA